MFEPSRISGAYFDPRSPRGGATFDEVITKLSRIFRSTLPTRGSDERLWLRRLRCADFDPRSPRGGATTYYADLLAFKKNFDPRSPRGGATCGEYNRLCGRGNFDPRSPRGGATRKQGRAAAHDIYFDPRSPRGGATARVACGQLRAGRYFDPRSPRGGATPRADYMPKASLPFRSTLPTRGSDVPVPPLCRRGGGFRSTLPTRGSDREDAAQSKEDNDFDPRSPRGGATFPLRAGKGSLAISIHAPHEGERRSRAAYP